MPHRVLILSASVGAGHLRAAEALALAFAQSRPDIAVKNIDVLTLTNALFRRVYGKAYLDLVNRAPHLLGYIYDLTDKPGPRSRAEDRLRSLTQRLNLGRVIDLFDEPWDIVVNTHFLPADILASLRRRKKSLLRQVTVVTDFDAHAFWVNNPTDRYYVATEEAALSLAHWGVDRSIIDVVGIPVHPVFAAPKTAQECRRKHNLASDRPVVLLLAGGFGVGPIERIYEAILAMDLPVQVAVVAGKNAALKTRLEKLTVPRHQRARVIGFTTEMDELMAAADVVVTKPGGLTTSEVLARGAVMAIMNPIPGQESRNSDYLLENAAAIKINSVASVGYKLTQLLGDAPRLARLRRAATGLGQPRAAFEIVERVVGMI